MILIGLGSSLSFAGRSPGEIILCASASIARFGLVRAVSRLYTSAAWPDPNDPPFVNACIAVETALGPTAFLATLQAVEAGFGRRRGRRYGPRTLDLDLLDYDGRVHVDAGPPPLELPHPALAARKFVLAPLQDVAPKWRHPVTGESVSALLAGVPGAVNVFG